MKKSLSEVWNDVDPYNDMEWHIIWLESVILLSFGSAA